MLERDENKRKKSEEILIELNVSILKSKSLNIFPKHVIYQISCHFSKPGSCFDYKKMILTL